MATGLANATQSVKELKVALSNGVKLDKESADALVASINNGIGRVNDALAESSAQGHDVLKIGSTPAADLYKPVYRKVNVDPDQGGEAALTKLKQQLEDARDTVKACVRATQETDAGSGTGLRNAG